MRQILNDTLVLMLLPLIIYSFYKLSVLEEKIQLLQSVISSLEEKNAVLEKASLEAFKKGIIAPPFFGLSQLFWDDVVLALSTMSFCALMLFFKENFILLEALRRQNDALMVLVQSNVAQEIVSDVAILLP
jgi:hypothetical protein